jgi:hypothetical protein
VTILDDSLHESTETVKLILKSPAGGATLGSQKTAVIKITDDDLSNGQFEFAGPTYISAENAGTVTVAVYRNGGASGAASVVYATSNGTATAGLDYTASTGALSFADGETEKTFNVTILDNSLHETTEMFKLTLKSPSGGATLGSQKTAVISIIDDDASNGQFAFSNAAYTVAENAGTVTVVVYRSSGASGVASVVYATSNGTATAGLDYTSTTGTLSFADGETSKTFDVTILDDSMNEPAETVKLALKSPSGGATLGSQKTAVVSITNDDASNGQFAFSSAAYTVAENAGSVSVAVYRSGGASGVASVVYATSNGTATVGLDYTSTTGALSFTDGETAKTFDVTIIDDSLHESTETVKIALKSPTGGATLGSQRAAVLSITDDDASNGQFEFSSPTYLTAEDAGTVTVAVYRSGGATGVASVVYATSNSTARTGEDFISATGALSFADGETSKTFDITVLDDSINEPTETAKLILKSPTGGATLGTQKSAVLSITDNDASNGQFEFAGPTYLAAENAGTVTVAVYRNGGANGVASVVYATSNGTATAGQDYTAATGTLSFADGETAKTFDVAIIDDSLHESTETVKLALKSPTGGATLGTLKSAVLTITDNDASNGQFEFANPTYLAVENAGTVAVAVYRNGGSAGVASVVYAASNGTAQTGADFTASTGTLSFADGETAKTFDVTILDDSLHELTETIKLALKSPTGGATLGTQKSAVLNITDDDASNGQFEFANPTYLAVENAGTVAVAVYRYGGASGVASVVYATSNATATSGLDYTAATGTLNFADGEESKTFDVTILDDSLHESTETFKLALKSPTGGATLGAQKSAVMSITDDDASNGQFEFSDAAYTLPENGGTVNIAVYRNGGANGVASVVYATSKGSAAAGLDYTETTGALSFADGEESKTFGVTILDDTAHEPTETVRLALKSPTGGATLGSQKTAVLSITDDDASNGQFEFSNVSFTYLENAGTVTIAVYRNEGSNGVASVVYSTSNGTAAAGSDYTEATGALDFADGEIIKTFTVTIIEDNLYENTETVKLTLKNPTGGATLGILKSAVIRITNNDQPNGEIEFG